MLLFSNKDKADEEVERIKTSLNKEGFSSLKWMLILDNSEKKSETNDIIGLKKQPLSKWKYFAKLDTSTIDVIIFKMVITEGWDIRRACMLYQVRDTKSKQLDEQVIGRVRRNPRLLDFETLSPEAQELISKAYVWGIHEKEQSYLRTTTLFGTEMGNPIQQEIRVRTTRLKPFSAENEVNIDTLFLRPIEALTPQSIFDLYREVRKSTIEVQQHYAGWVDDFQKFFMFAENIGLIKRKINDACCDYGRYMECVSDDTGKVCEATFPYLSSFVPTAYEKDIDSWVWRQKREDDEFCFDSQAEKEWVKVMMRLRKKGVVKSIPVDDEDVALIGKNFLENSEIKYEYYSSGRHFSYPDFLFKDVRERIHIFEVKSLNNSSAKEIDSEAYKAKTEELKSLYTEASKLTEHYYYLPIKRNDEWHVWRMKDGEVKNLSLDDFFRELQIT